jgi:hypothetical protein
MCILAAIIPPPPLLRRNSTTIANDTRPCYPASGLVHYPWTVTAHRAVCGVRPEKNEGWQSPATELRFVQSLRSFAMTALQQS